MKCEAVSHAAVCLRTDAGEDPDASRITAEVRLALQVCGYAVWDRICLEAYINEKGGFIFARPG